MPPRIYYRLLPLLVCLIACVVVDLAYFPNRIIFPDEIRIFGSAVEIATKGTFSAGGDRAWEMPGTALFYTPAVWLFGAQGAVIPLRFAQAFLLVIQSLLAGSMARRLFGSTNAGLTASWIVATYPFLLFYQGLLLSETLFTTLLLAGMASLFWWRDRGMRIDHSFVISIVCFAAATMTKATLTVLPPLLLAATAFFSRADWLRCARILVAALCIYALCMSPWWIRNAFVLHAFVPFTTGSSMNLYLGNNLRNTEAGISWARDSEPDVVARISGLPGEIERDRAFRETAIAYIREQPQRFLVMAGKKFVRLWNLVPNASEFRSSPYVFLSVATYGSVLILALTCAFQWRRRWRALIPIYLTIGYFSLVHIVTIASLRYRIPLEPLLIVLAAAPLASLIAKANKAVAHPIQTAAEADNHK